MYIQEQDLGERDEDLLTFRWVFGHSLLREPFGSTSVGPVRDGVSRGRATRGRTGVVDGSVLVSGAPPGHWCPFLVPGVGVPKTGVLSFVGVKWEVDH